MISKKLPKKDLFNYIGSIIFLFLLMKQNLELICIVNGVHNVMKKITLAKNIIRMELKDLN